MNDMISMKFFYEPSFIIDDALWDVGWLVKGKS